MSERQGSFVTRILAVLLACSGIAIVAAADAAAHEGAASQYLETELLYPAFGNRLAPDLRT